MNWIRARVHRGLLIDLGWQSLNRFSDRVFNHVCLINQSLDVLFSMQSLGYFLNNVFMEGIKWRR